MDDEVWEKQVELIVWRSAQRLAGKDGPRAKCHGFPSIRK